MIPSLLCLLALAVLPVRAQQPDLNVCFDTTSQNAPMACFMPSRCLPSDRRPAVDALSHATAFEGAGRSAAGRCDALVAFKKFTDDKWLVMMHLRNDDNEKEIAIHLGQNPLFGCKSDGNAVTVETGPLTKEINKAVVRAGFLECKFTVDLTYQVSQQLSGSAPFALVLSGAGKKFSVMANIANSFITATRRCDGSKLDFHDAPVIPGGYTSIRPLVEYDKVKCGPDETLYVVNGGKEYKNPTLECPAGSTSYTDYKVTEANGAVIQLKPGFKVACTVKTCTRCGDIAAPPGVADDLRPRLAQAAGCAQLTCDGDRFKIEGVNATIAKPICREFVPGDFRWTIKYGSDSAPKEQSFLTAACASRVNCNDLHPLRVVCDTPAACESINPWSDRISCPSDFTLAARSSPTSAWSLITWIDCQDKSGEWSKVVKREGASDPDYAALAPTEEIKCLSTQEVEDLKAAKQNSDGATTQEPSQPAAAGLSVTEAVIIAVVVLLGIGIIGAIIFFTYRRKRDVKADSAGEVDAKAPTPPPVPDSDKLLAGEVSFSGSRKPPTPSLKTPQPEPPAPKLTIKSVPSTGTPPPWQAASGKQFEDAVSVTAHPAPPSEGSSTKPTPPPMPSSSAPRAPDPADLSKKKLKDLLEQSVPSMSE